MLFVATRGDISTKWYRDQNGTVFYSGYDRIILFFIPQKFSQKSEAVGNVIGRISPAGAPRMVTMWPRYIDAVFETLCFFLYRMYLFRIAFVHFEGFKTLSP